MLARHELLLPSLHFGLSRKGRCGQDAIHQGRQSILRLVQGPAFETARLSLGVVAVLVSLCRDRKLGDLLRRLITLEDGHPGQQPEIDRTRAKKFEPTFSGFLVRLILIANGCCFDW